MLRSLRALGLFALLTVGLTWPLASNLTVMDAGDSAFFAWEIAWELHALTQDPANLAHANIFHPLRYTLGMDEPVLGTTILAAPLWLFTHDAVLVYNLVRLLTFAFTENLVNYNNSPDIGFQIGWAYSPALKPP